MRTYICILTAGALLLSVALLTSAKDFYKFEDCGKEGEAIAHFDYVNFSSHPISMSGNVQVSARVKVSRDIPENCHIEVKDYRVITIFGLTADIRIPCLKGFGSCKYKACEFLTLRNQQACPFFPPGVDCKCPVKAGIYEGDKVTVPMPNLSSFTKFIASGKYKSTIELTCEDDNGIKKELGCVRTQVQLKS